MAKSKKEVRGGVVMYLDGRAVESNAKAIQAEMRKVKKEIDACTIGSDEYVQKTKQYRQLNAILQEHKGKLREVNTQITQNNTAQKNWLQWGISKFNEYSVAILGAAAALTGVTMKLQEFRKKGREKEESQANLKALTGLDDGSIQWLTHKAEELSTTMDETGLRIRQSSREILDAYTLVGSAKPELLNDKEALNGVTVEAIRLANAAKMELKPAADGLTLAMNQYGAAANEASRYTNALAAGSKFGSAGVEDQTEAIVKSGVAASVANVKIENLVGSIETLAERGIKGKIAGTGLKTFFLKLEGMADDVRPSVVGLQQALENLQDKQLSASEMQKMFGLEAYTVAQAMISGAEKVKYYTEAVTGTNTATEQAAINSETSAAKLDQLKNKMNETGMVLAERLSPFFNHFVNLTSKFVQIMPGLLDWLERYGVQFAVLAASIYLYNVRMKIAAALTTAWNTVTKVATAVTTAYRTAMVLTNEAIAGCSIATTRLGLALRNQNLLIKASTAATALLKAAWYALTFQFNASANALKAFRVAMASTGIGVFILLAGAVAAAIYEYHQKVKAAGDALKEKHRQEKEAMKDYSDAYAKLTALKKILEDETVSLNQRKKALEEIRSIVPGYHADLTKEGKLINNNTAALDEYLERLRKVTLFKANQDKLVELYKQKQELEDEYQKASEEYWNTRQTNTLQGTRSTAGQRFVQGVSKLFGLSKEANEHEEMVDLEKKLRKVEHDIDGLESKVGKLSDFEEPAEPTAPPSGDGDDGDGGGGSSSSGKVESAQKEKQALNAITAEYLEKENALRQQYASDVTMTQAEFNRRMEALELERLEKSMQVAGLEPKEREELQKKVLDIYVNAKERFTSYLESIRDEELKGYALELANLKDAEAKEIAALDDAYAHKLMSEEEYQAMLADIRQRYAKKQEDAWTNSDEYKQSKSLMSELYSRDKVNENALNAMSGNLDAVSYYKSIIEQINDATQQLSVMDPNSEEYKSLKSNLDGMYDMLEESGLNVTELAQDIGAALGQGLAGAVRGEADDVKEAFKSLLKVMIDAIEKMMLAAISKKTIEAVSDGGPIGLLKAAPEIALITAAFESIKGLLDGWQSGGYTGYGAPDAPAGIVHRNEFVANRYALANPDIKPVLDLLDVAQRNGNVQNLTADDIAAVSGGRGRRYDETPRPVININNDNKELEKVLNRVESTMTDAAEAYRRPSVAKCYLKGPGGINDEQELLQRMERNARRK